MKLFLKNNRLRCSFRVIYLAFSWTVSLVCGIYFSANEPLVASWMRLLPVCQVSIVGLSVVLFLPLFISILCVYYAKPIVIYFISALKGFLFGYCLCGLALAFGDSGWLMRILLLFSDSCMCIVLLWFWVRQVNGRSAAFRSDCFFATAAALVIGIIDYYLVSPFLVSLMDHF